MSNNNSNTLFQGSDPELVKAYVLGRRIQWQSNGTWVDIPDYGDTSKVWRVTDKHHIFRIKPDFTFLFFHTGGRFKEQGHQELYTFNYPESKPYGPYVMLKLNSVKEVIDSYSSTTMDVCNDNPFFS